MLVHSMKEHAVVWDTSLDRLVATHANAYKQL
jgi:hypothetical protein